LLALRQTRYLVAPLWENDAMTCNWCEKSAAELFPVPGKDGSATMVCRSCADVAQRLGKWTMFLATALMPAAGGGRHQDGEVDQDAPSRLN
jgi:hypothetical protein